MQQEVMFLPQSIAIMLAEEGFVARSRELDLGEGAMVKLSEITLHPRSGIELFASEPSLQFILPVVGDVCLKFGLEVQVGELWAQGKNAGERFYLSNSISSQSIHLIRIEIQSTGFFRESISPFQAKNIENRIQPIFTHKCGGEYYRISLGKVGGRKDAAFSTHASSLAFVISGALEYQNRLLERGDCLWTGGAADLEMESLAEESLILILEIRRRVAKSTGALLI